MLKLGKKELIMKTLKGWLRGGLKTLVKWFTSSVKGTDITGKNLTEVPRNMNRSNIYHRCSDTNMDVFIDCLVNQKLERLIRFGSASPSQLEAAWESLFNEYCDLIKSPQYQYILSLSKDIGLLSTKLLTVRACLHVLSFRYSEKAIRVLISYGYKEKFPREDLLAYKASLERISLKLKAVEIALEQRKQEYHLATIDTGKKVSEESFVNTFLVLSKYMGYHVKPSQITVLEYAALLKAYEKEVELLKKRK